MTSALSLICAATMLLACTEDGPVTNPRQEETVVPQKETGFAYGADVSWITEYENKGYTFTTPGEDGQEMELMQLLRDYCGTNSIRLRVWVNPVEGWNNIDDVVLKARRAEALGLRTMIDFHLSDDWADPSKQVVPAAWEGLDIDGICTEVANHITQTLNALKAAGVTPEWVQVGNETTPGMLLPYGSVTDNPEGMARIVDTGYGAVKAVFPDAYVIVHLDCGHNQWRYDRFLGVLEQYGARYDMIGMSAYYYWAAEDGYTKGLDSYIADVAANVDHLSATYGKPVMVVEVGDKYNEPERCNQLITALKQMPIEGIFYWEPEADPAQYELGCFKDGAPTSALDAFKH